MTPRMIFVDGKRFTCVVALAISTGAIIPACRRDVDETPNANSPPAVKKKQPDLLVFPDELRIEDDSVNGFVERAMRECASGDYARFRLLWATREEPLARGDYEQGWQAVQEIRIRLLRQIELVAEEAKPAERAYAVAADVSLDPDHPAGVKEPNRRVVLLAVREKDEWRLATAPRPVRAWVETQLPGETVDTAHGADEPVPSAP